MTSISGSPLIYNLPQTVFMLSQGSNYLFDQKASLYELQSAITAFLEPGGRFYELLNTPNPSYPCLALAEGQTSADWTTVWGPVVYQADDNPGATNVMYVANSAKLNTYVVAIAGTNPTGWSAAVVQDLKVGPGNMVSWPPTVAAAAGGGPATLSFTANGDDPTACCIDQGTADGVGILFTMQDRSRNGNLTLAQFLAGLYDTNSQAGQTLVFTGHSLGGALSPTLAMLFYPQAAQSTAPAQDTMPNQASGWEHVFILPTAGPTPGTAAFAAQFCTPVTQTIVPLSVLPIVAPSPFSPPTGLTGPYAPAPTGAAPSGTPAQFGYWNMIYANVYDVVPRAWNGLGMLVTEHTTDLIVDYYPSFFADGSVLGGADVGGAGVTVFALIEAMKTLSGYPYGADLTPYYTPCLPHYPINGATTGAWGQWEATAAVFPATTYPATWTAFPNLPTSLTQPPVAPYLEEVFTDISPYVLNAHLDQYAFALLGYAAPSYVTDPPPPLPV